MRISNLVYFQCYGRGYLKPYLYGYRGTFHPNRDKIYELLENSCVEYYTEYLDKLSKNKPIEIIYKYGHYRKSCICRDITIAELFSYLCNVSYFKLIKHYNLVNINFYQWTEYLEINITDLSRRIINNDFIFIYNLILKTIKRKFHEETQKSTH